MGRYGDDGEVPLIRSVTPENSVRGRGVLLRVRNEHLLISMVGIGDGHKFMGLQARMPGVHLQLLNALAYLLEEPFRLWTISSLPIPSEPAKQL